MNKEKLVELIEYSKQKNKFGEEVVLVGATKYQPVAVINEAISLGLAHIGENKADEFRDKFEFYAKVKKHFIGHLQTNKIKYLVGKVDLYHSIDSLHLAEELDKASKKNNVVSNILLQVNIGREESKSGFEYDEVINIYNTIKSMANLKIEGLMAMLPKSDDEKYLRELAKKSRIIFGRKPRPLPPVRTVRCIAGLSGANEEGADPAGAGHAEPADHGAQQNQRGYPHPYAAQRCH